MISRELSIDKFISFKRYNLDLLPQLLIPPAVNLPVSESHGKQKQGEFNDWRKREANNWMTQAKKSRDDDEKLYSQVRTTLNKLSDENFDTLLLEIKNMNLKESHHLEKLSELIFNKALIEPKFCVWYAKLAYELSCYGKNSDTNTLFRAKLIDRCQQMFSDIIITNDNGVNAVSKELSCGYVRFVGELYVCGLLPNKIINGCCLTLLKIKEKEKKDDLKMIDCLCSLIKVIGKTFASNCPDDTVSLFNKIDELMKSGQLVPKEKFALMDIKDLCKNGKWI